MNEEDEDDELPLFQSYQFRQINPDVKKAKSFDGFFGGFNRINSGRSIPTQTRTKTDTGVCSVSIVSIQADQSRQSMLFSRRAVKDPVSIVSIQADQSRQCSVDSGTGMRRRVSIVSIQSDQSRHQQPLVGFMLLLKSFNRINSVRSIPTCGMVENILHV